MAASAVTCDPVFWIVAAVGMTSQRRRDSALRDVQDEAELEADIITYNSLQCVDVGIAAKRQDCR